MKALIELAQAVSDGEKTQDVSDVVKRALEQCKEEREVAASNEIVALVRKIDAHKAAKRLEIKQLKAALSKVIGSLDELDRRWEFAQKSNNFVPLLTFFGEVNERDFVSQEEFATLSQVPSDFAAKAKTKKR